MDIDSFRTALLKSKLCSVESRQSTVDDYFEQYHWTLTKLADQLSPVRRITLRRQRLALWMRL